MRRRLWTFLALLACVSGEYLMGGHLDNNAGSKTRSGKTESSSTSVRKTRLDDLDLDLVAAESTVAAGATAETPTGDDDDVPRNHIPYPFVFNGGKPFSLEKDPITGKIDFEKAPPVQVLNYTGGYRERGDKEGEGGGDDGGKDDGKGSAGREKMKGKDGHDVGLNEINMPNFHDFLNLPVHYSSDKYGNDKYPVISSSYANTKVQSGANSYSTYNHRPHYPESDMYVLPVKNTYAPTIKTSTYRTTTVSDLKAKWTSVTSSSTTTATSTAPPITTNSSLTVSSISTKAPVVTTWKPSSTPIALHSIDRTEKENEKNLLPIEKLHASGHMGSHRNPSDGTTEKAQITRYKDQPNLNNFVLSQARPEMRPSEQNEEYKDSYDGYESDDEGEESDYFLPDLLKEVVTSASSTTTSRTTTSTTTASTSTTITASAETTTSTTIAPPRSVTSTTSTLLQEDVSANKPLQFPTKSQQPIVPSSLSNDRRPGVTERYDVIGHGYRPSPIIKPEPNRMGAGVVIESTSNIVIPPDQDTVSFVLGNRQNVEGGYYSVGSAVGENPYGSLSETDALFWPLRNDPYNPTKEVKHEHLLVPVTEPNLVTHKWWPPNSSLLKGSNELDPTKPQNPLIIATGTVVHDTKNPSKEKDSGYIIFPDNGTKNKDALTEEHIVIINEADGSIRELPPKTTLMTATTTMNKTILNLPADIIGDLPQLAEDLVPPVESSRPPSYYYNYQFDTPRPNHSRPQRLPLPPRIKPPSGLPVPPLDVGVRKRPYSPDTKLPNILPQFRPNAKASHGHRGPDVIGTMPAGQSGSTRIRQPLPAPSRRPLPLPPPSYLQRLNPPPPPIHAIRLAFTPTSKMDSVVLPHETEPTIRRLRPPHGVSSISRVGQEENAPSNRLFAHSGGEDGENRKEDRGKIEIADERESESSEKYPEEPPMTPPRPPLFPKRRTADPPRVTTLQMIQHHGEFGEEGDEAQSAESVLAHEAERRKSDNHDPSEIPEQPVYVVYPVNTAVNIHPDDSNEKDGSVVVGTRGPQRPLPPDTLLQNEQDDTHTVYNGRPVTLDFPYPLERPDPSSVFPAISVKETPVLIPSEQRQQQQHQASAAITNERENEKNDAVNVIPYLQDYLPYRKKNEAAISVTLHRTAPIVTSLSTSTSAALTSTPIAYVYTPTHAPHPAHHLDEDFDNDDADAKQTVLLPSQQPSSSSSSAPAPQNFMAPFVASMSAEAPSKNGWSVVVVEPPVDAERKSDNDSDEAKPADSENDTQTEKNEFDADNFKPQLFGGFKPLYEFPTEDMERHKVTDADTEINMPRNFKELLPVPDKG